MFKMLKQILLFYIEKNKNNFYKYISIFKYKNIILL